MDRMLVGLFIGLLAFGATDQGTCEEELDISSSPEMDLDAGADGADSDLTLETDGKQIVGGTRVRFAPVDDPEASVTDTLYWRGIPGVVAAYTTPVTIEVDGSTVIAPVRSISDAKVAETEMSYPSEGRAKLDEGDHTISPGEMRFRLHHGELSSKHPALAFGDDEIVILCAPIRFDAADAAGALTPVPVTLHLGKQSLLRTEASFAPLIIWLPVGTSYDSNFGTFAITAEGAVKPDRLAPGVSVTADGLRMAAKALATATATRAAKAETEIIQAGGLRLFVPEQIAPDGLLAIACVASEYGSAAGKPWAQGAFAFYGPAIGGPPSAYSPTTEAPDAALAQRAATKLDVEPDELVWTAMRPPTGLTGAFAFMFSNGQIVFNHAVLISAADQPFCLVPYRMRSAFEQGEREIYQVLMPDGFPGGEASVRCAGADDAAKAVDLGRVSLPAVTGMPFDSRLIELDCSALAPGGYHLWLEAPGRRTAPIALTILPRWLPRSGFFLHTMSCCVSPPASDDAGLDALRAAGIEMTTTVGHASALGINLPAIDPLVAAGAQARGLPVELALRPDYNDQVLDRMLRKRVRMVDEIVARGLHFYNEGLSYHHSYQPSIDRNVRRMQIFTQHTADFPSWMGGNSSWFPTWWGYVEGGVPTDAHTHDRNLALAAACAGAGLVEPTADERAWYDANMLAEDPEIRAKADALRRRGVEFWKGREALAYGKHNLIYNRAIREVRPGTTCLLFENAGHDSGKGTNALFTDMDAASYESYTDYGEWPMSAGWTADHARGACPGKPVWITVDWGTSTEGQLKSLATTFARGATGGASPMPAERGLGHVARMGTGFQFLAQYGAIAAQATPDQRVGVLRAMGIKSMQFWETHALYYHLVRLGCPPAVVTDDTAIASGVPAHIETLCIPRRIEPLDERIVAAIAAFQKAGGKVIEPADTVAPIDGAITFDATLRTMWEVGGFEQKAHQAMWREFAQVRAPLAAALAEAGIAPLVATDPDRGLAFTLDAGAVRYAVVLADAKDSKYGDFKATEDLPLTIAGVGWRARDLAKQIDLIGVEADGATTFTVDLITEPTTIVAFVKAAPGAVQMRAQAATLGGELVVAADVLDRVGGAALGPVPMAFTIIDPSGAERDTVFRAAGDELRFALAAREQSGAWRVRAQELLTGMATTVDITVAPAAAPPAVTLVPPVHVVDHAHLRAFAMREREKLIIVEPGQEAHLPLAERLVAAITGAGGGAARLWQVRPQDYNSIPLRWYPRADDQAQMALVDQGQLIGFRLNLTPYIDRREFVQAHIPEKGGWTDISPSYQVGSDCVVFSGGRLANSLRDVTLWMETANVPGKGQGRLVTVLSPFVADRHCTAVVANDAAGFAAATDALAKVLADTPAPIASVARPATKLSAIAGVAETLPVRRPYQGFTPVRRVQRLIANRAGAAVVGIDAKGDSIAFVDAQGAITATASPAGGLKRYDRIDDAGALWHYVSEPTAFNAAWHFATSHAVTAQRILPDGTMAREVRVYDGDTDGIAPGWEFESCFPIGPDGATVALGRKAGLLLGTLGGNAWKRYDDLPHVRVSFELRSPRFPVGITFAPDSSHVLFTMDTRPAGFGPMNGSALQPCANETVLMATATGEKVWSLRADDHRSSDFATFTGFAAVASGGTLSAFADVNGMCRVVDRGGAVIASAMAYAKPGQYNAAIPHNGVGVWMDPAGALAAFGFRGRLLLAAKGKFTSIDVPGLCSGCVAGDGSLAVVADEGGQVRAYTPDGAPAWTFAAPEVGPLVAAAGARGFLVATSTGALISLDGAGKELRRIDLVAGAGRVAHPIAAPAAVPAAPDANGPMEYGEPDTLDIAKRLLAAKPIAAWKPTGDGHAAFGHTFHAMKAEIALSAGGAKDCFLHLVYRRGDGNTGVTVTTSGPDGGETFALDLPTPEYRVVDIPLRGPDARITVTTAGPCEIADCSLWSMQWPGANMAYVDLAGASGGEFDDFGSGEDGENGDDAGVAAQELESGVTTGVMKDCTVLWPNTDVDQVSGPWMKAKIPPLTMVDGKRFGNGALPGWADEGSKSGNFRGAWFTIDFAKPVAFSLVATYDRARQQSQVSTSLAVLDGPAGKAANVEETPALAGLIGNDQFWRLIELEEPVELRVVGVLSYNGAVAGLSEVEIYP